MADFLTAYSLTQPDKPAVIDDRPDGTVSTMTYAELNEAANRLSNVLLALGAHPGDTKVVWCGQNSPGLVVMVNAARKLGVTAVPLNYRLSDDEATYVTDHCDATIVYVDAEHAAMFSRIRANLPQVQHYLVFAGAVPDGMEDADALMAAASPDEPDIPAATEAGATMIYTSGTTGKPKGAFRRGGGGNPAQAAALLALIGYTPNDVYVPTGPLYHSGPGGFMGIALALGQTIVLQRKFDPQDWLRLVDKYKVTSTFSAPTPIRMITNLPAEVKAKYDVSSIKRMIANGCAVELRAQAGVPRRLPGRLAVGGLRQHRAQRELRAQAGGPAAQAGLVRPADADDRDRAVRRRRQRRHRLRAGAHRRAVREERRGVQRLLQAARQVRRGPTRGLSRPSATSPTATRKASSTSAIARRT